MASQGAVFIDFLGLSEQNRSMYLQRCFSLTADSIDSPWVLKVKLFFFWFRSCWGFKPWGQILLLEMPWIPLECGSLHCCSACGLHSSRISPSPAYLWQGQRRVCSHLFLQGRDWLDCLEEGISHDDGQADREGNATPPLPLQLALPMPSKTGTYPGSSL